MAQITSTEMTDKQKEELEELVQTLQAIKGSHTELVSVLIPAGQNINLVQRQLEAEKSTAANIKSKTTRSNVTNALEAAIRKMKEIKQTPPNGLVIYSGNISQKEGVTDLQIWVYEPPKPLNTRLYRCDKQFVIEPLKEMLEVSEVYGLLVIDRQEATIGLLEGKQIKVIRNLTSGIPGKVRAGGQCLSPDTLIETKKGKKQIKNLKVGEEIKALDISNANIIFTKCTNKWNQTKDNYLEIKTNNNSIICSLDHTIFIHDTDNYKLIEMSADLINNNAILLNNKQKDEIIKKIIKKDKKIELIDIETEAGNFFANDILVHNSSQRYHRITEGLVKEFFRRVAEAMKDIFFAMPKLKGILIGGPIPTKEEFIDEGQLVTKLKEKIIAVKDLGYTDEHGLELLVEDSWEDIAQQELIKEKNIVKKFFETLGKHPEKATYGLPKVTTALQRGAVEILYIAKTMLKTHAHEIKALEDLATNIGAEVVIISDDNQDGEQFYNLTKGYGAVLRFPFE